MKKALHSFLLMCLMTAQLFLPMKAYAFPPALVWAFGASVALHAGALLFKLDDVQPPAAAGTTGGGGVSFKLDGKPTITPSGWQSPTVPPTNLTLTFDHVKSKAETSCRTFLSSEGKSYVSVSYYSGPDANAQFSYWCNHATGRYQLFITGTCPSGYVKSATYGKCTVSDASLVRKPSGVECEFVYKAGKFVPDPQNPACDGKATNTISRTGCDLTTTEQKMFMNCPATNSTLEMTPTQLSGTSEAGSFSVPAAVDENGVYTVTVPANLGILPPSDKITVDFYGSVNGGQWGCIDGHCKNTATGSTGGTGGDTGGSTGGDTGGSTGGTTGDGSGTGTGTGTGDASGPSTGDGSGDSWLDDVEGFFDGAIGKIKAFFTGGAGDAAPSNTPIDKSNVSLQLKTGDSYMSGGQCPPPQRIAVQFYGPATIIEIPYTMFCDLASMLRPVVIAISYLTAGYIVFRRN